MLIAIKVVNAQKTAEQGVFICIKKRHFSRIATAFRDGLFEGHTLGLDQDMYVSNMPMTNVVISNDPTQQASPYMKALQITFECADKNLSNNTFPIDAKVFEVDGDFIDLSREATTPLQTVSLLDLNNDLEHECTLSGVNLPFKKLFHGEDTIGYSHAQYGIAVKQDAEPLPLLERTDRKNIFGTSTLRGAGVIRINSTLRSEYMCECCGDKKTLTASHFGVIQATCPVCDVGGYIEHFTTKTPANALQRTFVPVAMAERLVRAPVNVREFFKFQAMSDYISDAKQITQDYHLEREVKAFL